MAGLGGLNHGGLRITLDEAFCRIRILLLLTASKPKSIYDYHKCEVLGMTLIRHNILNSATRDLQIGTHISLGPIQASLSCP